MACVRGLQSCRGLSPWPSRCLHGVGTFSAPAGMRGMRGLWMREFFLCDSDRAPDTAVANPPSL